MAEARSAPKVQAPTTPVAECIAVEQALQRHHLLTPHEDPPENMFGPFTVAEPEQGSWGSRQEAPTVHWAHVDSGSMVCIVYEGVLAAFPSLGRYKRPWKHEVVGIGGRKTQINGKLVGVPVCLGDKPNKGPIVSVTFYILGGCMEYHWLFGLTLLQPIEGTIFCAQRML